MIIHIEGCAAVTFYPISKSSQEPVFCCHSMKMICRLSFYLHHNLLLKAIIGHAATNSVQYMYLGLHDEGKLAEFTPLNIRALDPAL